MKGIVNDRRATGSISLLLILILLFACAQTEIGEPSQPLPTITTAVTASAEPLAQATAQATATQTKPQTSPLPPPTSVPTASSTPILTATSARLPLATPEPTPTRPPTAPYGPLELISQLGGYTGAVASQDTTVYLGSGRRMIILDMTNPAQLVVLGQTALLPGLIQAMTVANDHAYMAVAGSGLYIFQVVDPSNPIPVGFFATGTATPNFEADWDLALVGTHVYLLDDVRKGMTIIDVSEPTSPVESAFYALPKSGLGLAMTETHAYIAGGESGLFIVDVSDPAKPAQIGYLRQRAWDVAVQGRYAYVVDGQQQMAVVDVSDATNPLVVAAYETENMSPTKVTAVDDRLYLSDSFGTRGTRTVFYQYGPPAPSGQLHLLDVTDPAQPRETGAHTMAAPIWSAAFSGEYALLASGSLHVIDVRQPAYPVEVGLYRAPGEVWGISRTGNQLYVAAGTHGLHVVDTTDLATPVDIGATNTSPPLFAFFSAGVGEHAFIANPLLAHVPDGMAEGLGVIRVVDPAAPTPVDLMDKPIDEPEPYWAARSLSTAENRLYAVVNGTLYSVDPANATDLLEVTTSATGRVNTVAVKAPYLYVAAQEGLTITDVSNPVTGEVGFASYDSLSVGCTGEDSVGDYGIEHIAVAAGHAYVDYVTYLGDGKHSTLCVIDVADSEAPAALGLYDVPGSIRDIAATETAVYVATSSALVVYKTADPSALTITGRLPLPGWDVVVDGKTIYLAAGAEGLYILHLE